MRFTFSKAKFVAQILGLLLFILYTARLTARHGECAKTFDKAILKDVGHILPIVFFVESRKALIWPWQILEVQMTCSLVPYNG